MHQILAYSALANNGLLTDMVAIPDESYSARGGTTGANHWIFTENYNLMAVMGAGATITQLQIFDPTLNAINIPQVYPINLGITPLTNPNVMDWRQLPQPLPLNEEIAMQCSGGGGGAEDDYALIWIMPQGDMSYQAQGQAASLTLPRIFAAVTATIVLTKGVWSASANIVFTNPLKGGAYQINGAWWVIAHALAYKINFNKAWQAPGTNRKMYPGSLVENAYGNVPLRFGTQWMGPMGRFNNFELPKVSALGTTTEAGAVYNGILDLTYLGTAGPDANP